MCEWKYAAVYIYRNQNLRGAQLSSQKNQKITFVDIHISQTTKKILNPQNPRNKGIERGFTLANDSSSFLFYFIANVYFSSSIVYRFKESITNSVKNCSYAKI